MHQLPFGAVGFLYISGINIPEDLVQHFGDAKAIPNPFTDNLDYAKMYFTGYRARILPEGAYEII